MTDKCKASVHGTGQWGWLHKRQCTKKVWKDGYCKIHHPDSVKARQDEVAKRWRAKMDNSVEARHRSLTDACQEALEQMRLGNHAQAYTIIEGAIQ